MNEKLESLADKYRELERELSSPEIFQDQDRYKVIAKQHAEIGVIVSEFEAYKKILLEIADNQECLAKYGTNSVVAQTGVSPTIMLELIAKDIWHLEGVHGPESFDPDPYIERLAKYEFPAGMEEKDSEYAETLHQKALLAASK